MRRVPRRDRKGNFLGGWAMENAPTKKLTFGKDPNDPNARGKVHLNPDGSVADRRKFGYNNNTDYSGLLRATPEQMQSFMAGMHQKKLNDFDSFRGNPLMSSSRNALSSKIKEKDRSQNRVHNLRFQLQKAQQQGLSTGILRSQIAQEVAKHNWMAKQTYNPGYGRGMGLMDSSGGYGGVSFNKF